MASSKSHFKKESQERYNNKAKSPSNIGNRVIPLNMAISNVLLSNVS